MVKSLLLLLALTSATTVHAEDRAPTWREALAEVKTLEKLHRPAFDVRGGIEWFDETMHRATTTYEAAVVALPDESPDLPVAACELRSAARGVIETQLKRAIAVAANRATGSVVALYGSLRAQMFALDVGWTIKDAKLVRASEDTLLYGPSLDCTRPDVASLRVRLAELYATEARYPDKGRYSDAKISGPPTSKRGQRNAALAEIDGLYREVRASAASDPAVATLLDLASIGYCPRARKPAKAAVCIGRTMSVERALAIREAALAANDITLAATRLAHARLVGNVKTSAGAAAAETKKLLLDAPVGSQPHLLALLDLYGAARARKDMAQAYQFEQLLRIDLALPADRHGSTWAEIAARIGTIAHAEGRDLDAIATYAAAAKGTASTHSLCAPDEGCDARNFRVGLLVKQADLDPVNGAKLRREAEMLRADLMKLRADRAAEVRRRMGP